MCRNVHKDDQTFVENVGRLIIFGRHGEHVEYVHVCLSVSICSIACSMAVCGFFVCMYACMHVCV